MLIDIPVVYFLYLSPKVSHTGLDEFMKIPCDLILIRFLSFNGVRTYKCDFFFPFFFTLWVKAVQNTHYQYITFLLSYLILGPRERGSVRFRYNLNKLQLKASRSAGALKKFQNFVFAQCVVLKLKLKGNIYIFHIIKRCIFLNFSETSWCNLKIRGGSGFYIA